MGRESSEAVKRKVKKKNKFDAILTGSGAPKPEERLKLAVLKSALKNYCFIRDTSCNDLRDECMLYSGSLTEKVGLALRYPPYSTCSAWKQLSSAHNVFSKRDMKDAVSLVDLELALGAHGLIFCSDLVSYHCNRSFRAV